MPVIRWQLAANWVLSGKQHINLLSYSLSYYVQTYLAVWVWVRTFVDIPGYPAGQATHNCQAVDIRWRTPPSASSPISHNKNNNTNVHTLEPHRYLFPGCDSPGDKRDLPDAQVLLQHPPPISFPLPGRKEGSCIS